jgi:hypothetical protein
MSSATIVINQPTIMSEPSWALTSSGMADGSHPAPGTDNSNKEAEAVAKEAAEAAALVWRGGPHPVQPLIFIQ